MAWPRRKPRATKPVLATALLVVLLGIGFSAPSRGQTPPQGGPPPAVESIDWRWAFTQGGLTLVVMVLIWSYRKDMGKWADERVALERKISEQATAFQQGRVDEAIRYDRRLDELLKATTLALQTTTDAMSSHSMALALNTESSRVLTDTVRALDRRLERIEHNTNG